MTYYIVKFIEQNMYLRGKNLLVHEPGLASRYTKKQNARKAARSSSFSNMEFELQAACSCSHLVKKF